MTTEVADVAVVDEPLKDDAVVVEDQLDSEEDEEREHSRQVAEVEKILAKTPETDVGKTNEPSGEPKEKSKPAEDSTTPDEITQELLDRATSVGFDEAHTKRLYEAGLLEDSLVAFDRRLINSIKPDEDPATTADETEATNQPLPAKQIETPTQGDPKAPPPLDADVYDELLAQRDKYHEDRINQLESQIAQMQMLTGDVVQQKGKQFEGWFDQQIDGLGNEDLFGKGSINDLAADSEQHKNRQKLFDGYARMCIAQGIDPQKMDPASVARAFPAMFERDVIKTTQRKTIDRIRDAQGRFMNPTRTSSGGPPAKSQQVSEEEAYLEDLEKVKDIFARTP